MLQAHALRIYLTLFTLALTVGTAFAQEGEGGETASGLTTLVLLLGVGAIGALFIINWSQSAPDDNDE